MVRATGDEESIGLRLGEGEFPPEVDRVNFGAFLLAVLWAPFHRLWLWFGVFVALEVLEAVMGLSTPRFFDGPLSQLVAMVVFRVVYWTVTVAFALRANRLVWTEEHDRAARAQGESVLKRPATVAKYVSNQRVWAAVGLVALAVAPLSLLIGSAGSSPGVVGDVAATVGTQTILLAGLFVHDRLRIARRQPRS
jgi:hypothetical protein